MSKYDTVIYRQIKGKMTKVAEPKRPGRDNFVITWRGMDWSGFRTIAKCEEQFAELERKDNAMDDDFAVVER